MLTDLSYKNLGGTNTKVSAIGLGTGTGFTYIHKKRDTELVCILQKALDLGITFIDTAEVYFDGHAEEVIGKAFKKNRRKVFIATKFSPEHSSYKKVIKAAEESLARLQTDYIDLYQIHWPNSVIPIEETVHSLEELVKTGKVRYIGVCNFSLRQLRDLQKACPLPIISLQTEYNVLERSAERDVLPYAQKNNITIVAYTPLNSGTIVRKEKYAKILFSVAKKYAKTPSQIILNFLTSHPPVIAIPATTNTIHLIENINATNFILEKTDVQFLEETFMTEVTHIETETIKVESLGNHSAYKTAREALANKLHFFPSPKMLSIDIQQGNFLKPVRVRRMQKKHGIYKYELLNGRIRYWAWVIAFHGEKPIPAIIED